MRASLLVAVAGLALAQVPKPEKILVTRVFPQSGQTGPKCSSSRTISGKKAHQPGSRQKERHTERHRVDLPVDPNENHPHDGQTGMLINSAATDPRKED